MQHIKLRENGMNYEKHVKDMNYTSTGLFDLICMEERHDFKQHTLQVYLGSYYIYGTINWHNLKGYSQISFIRFLWF